MTDIKFLITGATGATASPNTPKTLEEMLFAAG
jgi:hypothetical protein